MRYLSVYYGTRVDLTEAVTHEAGHELYFYDDPAENSPITDPYSVYITTGAVFYVKAKNPDTNCVSELKSITVTSTTPPDPPVPTVCVITIPSVKGATTAHAAGQHEVDRGKPFNFTLTLDPGYDESIPEVYVNNQLLTTTSVRTAGSRVYSYTIESITEYVTIKILGIKENDPLSIDEASNVSYRVYSSEGTLYVDSPQDDTMALYGISGVLIIQKAIPAGTSSLLLPKGGYVVRIGMETYKIVI